MIAIHNDLPFSVAYPVLSTLFHVFCTLLSSLGLSGRGLKILDTLSPNFLILIPPNAIEIRLIALLRLIDSEIEPELSIMGVY